MTHNETDELVSAEWVESHLDEFQADDPAYRLLEVNNPTVTANSEYTPYEEGHIPGAKSVPTTTVLKEDGRFKDAEELRQLYEDVGVTPDQSVITYCRVGERSSIEWFVLHELLDFEDVENYDGSWTEWGNAIRAPIETGPSA